MFSIASRARIDCLSESGTGAVFPDSHSQNHLNQTMLVQHAGICLYCSANLFKSLHLLIYFNI